jgi:hypothetical protein
MVGLVSVSQLEGGMMTETIRFDRPFFFGEVEDMVFGVVFKDEDREGALYGQPSRGRLWLARMGFLLDHPSARPGRYLGAASACRVKPFTSKQDMLEEYQSYNAKV